MAIPINADVVSAAIWHERFKEPTVDLHDIPFDIYINGLCLRGKIVYHTARAIGIGQLDANVLFINTSLVQSMRRSIEHQKPHNV